MDTKRISAVAATALLALTASASAGPMNVPGAKIIAPPQTQTEPVYYRYYGYGWNPGLAIAGTAAGLLTLGAVAATGGWGYNGGYYGSPYYGYNAYYGGPYYGNYYGGPYYRHYGYYRHPYHRHYGYYGGGIHTGRSVGYGHMHHGAHHR